MAEGVKPARFRRDLHLYPGPRDFDGSPTFNLYDPSADKYFKFSWKEASIYRLTEPGMSFEEITAKLRRYTTIHLTEEDLKAFFEQAGALGLLELPKTSGEVYRTFERKKSHPLWWAIKNYLYFRVPLLHPDRFLDATLPYVRTLWSWGAILLYFMATIIGLIMVLGRWDEYIHTFSYFFDFQGFMAYGAAICFIKVIHEFSHAYTAKNYGVYVPTMGMAFICLWPVLYTDVTSSWQLARRNQRLAITVAGVVAEITIAGLSTLGWALSSPGIWQTVFFIFSTVTWISSLFININPAMRFDGYYLLCDLWGIDNLRSRAFAVGRWKLHRWLFDLDVPCPEENLGPQKIRQLWIYSYFSWVYLLIIYVVIALFVYYAFTKALGILLFLVEIAVFFIWPIVWEAQILYRLRDHFTVNRRLVMTCLATVVLFVWLMIPWPHETNFSAITIPDQSQELWIPEEGGVIAKLWVKRGSIVTKGQPLVEIVSKRLFSTMQMTQAESASMEHSLRKLTVQPEQRSHLATQKAQWEALKEKISALKEQQNDLILTAELSGTVYAWDETIKKGMPVSKGEIIGKIANTSKVKAVGFVPEQLYPLVKIGQDVKFNLPGTSISVRGVVTALDSINTSYLEYPALASTFKGPLAVVLDSEKRLRLSNTYYKVTVSLTPKEGEPLLPFGKVGTLKLQATPHSLFFTMISRLYSIILQESGL